MVEARGVQGELSDAHLLEVAEALELRRVDGGDDVGVQEDVAVYGI